MEGEDEEVVFIREVIDLTREIIDLVRPEHEVIDVDAGDNEEGEEEDQVDDGDGGGSSFDGATDHEVDLHEGANGIVVDLT